MKSGKKSRVIFERAKNAMPCGVTSNFRYWGDDNTLILKRAKGAYIWDQDDVRYIDYRLGFGPVILGHAHNSVVLKGYAFPFDVTYINIASMLVKFNKILGFIMAGAFIVADWLWVVFCYIAWSRAAFAWGLDRLGPKWFTDISPRFNQPIKLLLVMFVAAQLVLAHYCFNPEILGSISVEVLQLVSVFGFTAISALIFPYVKKVRHIWDASPYKNWKFLGIPMVTVSGFLALLLVLMLVVSYYISEAFAFMYTWWTIIYIGAWLFALGWYFVFKAVRAKAGIDVTLAFKEIPPE